MPPRGARHVVLYVEHLYIVQVILEQKNDRVAWGVREGQNMARNGPRL